MDNFIRAIQEFTDDKSMAIVGLCFIALLSACSNLEANTALAISGMIVALVTKGKSS